MIHMWTIEQYVRMDGFDQYSTCCLFANQDSRSVIESEQ